MSTDLKGPFDLSGELWREYEYTTPRDAVRVYRIDYPVALYYREGGFTHRVVDSEGVVHCVPGITNAGAVIRWQPRDAENPVQF